MDIYLTDILPNVFQNNYCLYIVSSSSEIQSDSKIFRALQLSGKILFWLKHYMQFFSSDKMFGSIAEKTDSDN